MTEHDDCVMEALQFYADKNNWNVARWGDGTCTAYAIPGTNEEGSFMCDCGDRARAALPQHGTVKPDSLCKVIPGRHLCSDSCKEVGECLYAPSSALPAATVVEPDMPPVCCYCDHDLACAHCGMEQTPENGSLRLPKSPALDPATLEACAKVAAETAKLWGDVHGSSANEAADKIRALAGSVSSTDRPDEVPSDSYGAFAYLVSRCASGLYKELVEKGKTDVQARNAAIHCFLDFASGEACRIARREGREPDKEKWQKAADAAFDRAVKRTADQVSQTDVVKS